MFLAKEKNRALNSVFIGLKNQTDIRYYKDTVFFFFEATLLTRTNKPIAAVESSTRSFANSK